MQPNLTKENYNRTRREIYITDYIHENCSILKRFAKVAYGNAAAECGHELCGWELITLKACQNNIMGYSNSIVAFLFQSMYFLYIYIYFLRIGFLM